MVVSALDVAASIIEQLHPIDNLKLQKLVYFAAGQHLALTGEPMFPDAIEAWDHGPVVNAVYAVYAGDMAINEPKQGVAAALDGMRFGCVSATVQFFGQKTGSDLRNLTHKRGPWSDYYEAGGRHRVIPNDALLRWFTDDLCGTRRLEPSDGRYAQSVTRDAKTNRAWTAPVSAEKLAVIERLSLAAAAKPAPPWIPRHTIR